MGFCYKLAKNPGRWTLSDGDCIIGFADIERYNPDGIDYLNLDLIAPVLFNYVYYTPSACGGV